MSKATDRLRDQKISDADDQVMVEHGELLFDKTASLKDRLAGEFTIGERMRNWRRKMSRATNRLRTERIGNSETADEDLPVGLKKLARAIVNAQRGISPGDLVYAEDLISSDNCISKAAAVGIAIGSGITTSNIVGGGICSPKLNMGGDYFTDKEEKVVAGKLMSKARDVLMPRVMSTAMTDVPMKTEEDREYDSVPDDEVDTEFMELGAQFHLEELEEK